MTLFFFVSQIRYDSCAAKCCQRLLIFRSLFIFNVFVTCTCLKLKLKPRFVSFLYFLSIQISCTFFVFLGVRFSSRLLSVCITFVQRCLHLEFYCQIGFSFDHLWVCFGLFVCVHREEVRASVWGW